MTFWKTKLTIATMAAVALFSASAAKAQDCETLPNPIYISGSSASQVLWNQIGPLLADAGYSLVYQKPGSCVGVSSIEGNQAGSPTLLTGSSFFWLTDGGSPSCTSNSDTVDVGVSDVFQSTCDIAVPPSLSPIPTIGSFNGATQVMTFIRPIDAANPAMPNEISAEQANFVFGTAAGDEISPWNESNEGSMTLPSFLYVRGPTSGTQSMIGEAILLDPNLFLGYVESGTGPLITAVAAQMTMAGDQAVLGIAVAGSGYDSKRSEVQALAFRGYQQSAAWLPDSSVATYDKRNVRQGLYTVFGPLQLLFNIDDSGKTDVSAATDPAAVTLVNWLSGAVALPNSAAEPIEQYEIAASFVPDCAMGVSRADTSIATIPGVQQGGFLGGNAEGAIVPNTTRAHSCDCYFESHVTSATATCTSCSKPSDCQGGYCGPNGVCEAF